MDQCRVREARSQAARGGPPRVGRARGPARSRRRRRPPGPAGPWADPTLWEARCRCSGRACGRPLEAGRSRESGEDPPQLALELDEGGQRPQLGVVPGEGPDPLDCTPDAETATAPRGQLRGGLEQPMKKFLGIRQSLDLPRRRQVETTSAVRVVGRGSQRGLVDQQPGLGHPDRHDAHGRRRSNLDRRQRGFDFPDPIGTRLPLRIPMHHQQSRRIEIDRGQDLVPQPLRLLGEGRRSPPTRCPRPSSRGPQAAS